MFNLRRVKIIFLLIFLLSFLLRLYEIEWDFGKHLHPDERMIIMVAQKLNLNNLNPHFFAYGSFPIYLLKAVGRILNSDDYDGLLYVGRTLSVFFDLITVIAIYKIGSLFIQPNKSFLPLMAAFLYAISVLPIQSSHFYTVDIPLTTFSTLAVLALLVFGKKPSFKNSLYVGLLLGILLATKVTMVLFIPTIIFVLLLIYLKKKSLKEILLFDFTIFAFAFLVFFVAEPYAILDFSEFKKQVLVQLQMNKNPYIFPYTLQYVGTIPYLYYLKNIILWGLGIPYGLMAVLSVLLTTIMIIKTVFFKKKLSDSDQTFLVLLIFFWIYFIVIGKTAVKFMRYFLPLYPIFAILTAYIFYQFKKFLLKRDSKLLLLFYFFIFSLLIWPFSFLRIYQKVHTRIVATNWINQNIEKGAKLGIEHWDDALPLYGGQNYIIYEYPLYNMDNFAKWANLTAKIAKTDYIILASNRLYVPLQKLTDCKKHGNYCYPYTASYYKHLFAGGLGFRLVASFSSYPMIPFLNIEINDDEADESFTVYDHPKIYVFKNEKYFNQEFLFKLITDLNPINP